MIDMDVNLEHEFKIKLTDSFEYEVISFLNMNGGNIYLGVNDDGEVVGLNGNVEFLKKIISDRIKYNILPSAIELCDVAILNEENKKYIKINISRGINGPYYLKGNKMNFNSYFNKAENSIKKMDQIENNNNDNLQNDLSSDIEDNESEDINLSNIPLDNSSSENLTLNNNKKSLCNILSPDQNLKFNQLKKYYKDNGFIINNNFLYQLGLYTEDNKYNYNAYLLSDNNNISIKFGKYNGDKPIFLTENIDFGNCSLIDATNNILNKIKDENKVINNNDTSSGEDKRMYEFNAVKEAVINAIIHNDWSNGYSPKFEMFSNKFVITSNGGICNNITKEEFLQGFSVPKNKELMKIFNDIKLTNQMGTGIIKILNYYDKKVFEFFPNFLRVSFPFENSNFDLYSYTGKVSNLSSTQNSILSLIHNSPKITEEKIANLLNINIRTVQRNIKCLISLGLLIRNGSKKNGSWVICSDENEK